MTLTEVIETFKTKLNPSKISNSLEKTASISDELENDSTDLNNNPYSNFGNDSVTSSNSIRTTQKTDQTLIKLTDVWKIYQMGEVEFAALKGINLEIYEGEFLGSSWTQWKWKKYSYESFGLSGFAIKR